MCLHAVRCHVMVIICSKLIQYWIKEVTGTFKRLNPDCVGNPRAITRVLLGGGSVAGYLCRHMHCTQIHNVAKLYKDSMTINGRRNVFKTA